MQIEALVTPVPWLYTSITMPASCQYAARSVLGSIQTAIAWQSVTILLPCFSQSAWCHSAKHIHYAKHTCISPLLLLDSTEAPGCVVSQQTEEAPKQGSWTNLLLSLHNVSQQLALVLAASINGPAQLCCCLLHILYKQFLVSHALVCKMYIVNCNAIQGMPVSRCATGSIR